MKFETVNKSSSCHFSSWRRFSVGCKSEVTSVINCWFIQTGSNCKLLPEDVFWVWIMSEERKKCLSVSRFLLRSTVSSLQTLFVLEIPETETHPSNFNPETETLLTSWNGFLFLGMELQKRRKRKRRKKSEDGETFLSLIPTELIRSDYKCWSGTSRCLAASLGRSIDSRLFPERWKHQSADSSLLHTRCLQVNHQDESGRTISLMMNLYIRTF